MRNYLREARLDLKGHYLNAICASMIYYVVAFAIVRIVMDIPLAVSYKYFIAVALMALILIPVTAGYIDYFKNRKNYSFPSPKVLFRFHDGYSSLLLCVLCIGMGLVFVFLAFYIVTVMAMIAAPPLSRIYILGAAVTVYIVFVLYVLCRFWMLFYLVLEKGKKPFTYYLKECLRLTKGKTKEYLKFVLRFWRLFLVCILPLGLGLLVFFPIFATAKQYYFADIISKDGKKF
ncbi:MAG: hypothetical protein J6A69_03715 [Clostridia bacterium]|nr:hypothetical protein [Clostridia bacterium]